MGLLETIQGNLDAARPSGTVPLDATTLTAAGQPVLDLFQEHLGAPAVAFRGDATVALAGGVLTVTGTGTGASAVVLGLSAPSLRAELTLAGGAGALQIALTIGGTGWTLRATFPQLAANTPLGALTFGTTPVFTLRSTDGAADKYGLLAPAGLSLATTIAVADAAPFSALTPIYALPAAGTTLDFAGPVTAAPGPEALSLRTGPGRTATRPLAVSGIGTFTLAQAAIALDAVATEGADRLWAGVAAAEVWGTASAGGRETVFAISPPSGVASWLLGVVPGLNVPLTQLLGVVPGLSVVPVLPDGVQQVIDGEVTAFSFVLSVAGTTATPTGLDIAVQTTTPWTILQGVLELKRLQLALELSWENGPRLLGGAVGGALMLGDVEVDVSVPLPATHGEILVWSQPDAALPGLGALAGLLGGADLAAALPPGVASLGGLRLLSLSATVGLSPPALPEVGLGLATAPWRILPGLVLDGVVLDVTVANPLTAPAVTGSIAGRASFGTGPHPATLTVAVQRWTPDGDWLLAADVRDVELPSLADFATLAGADPTTLLPASLAGQDDMRFTLVDLGIEADLTAGTLDLFHVQVAMKPWDIAPGYFRVDQLGGSLVIDWRSGAAVYSGQLIATLAFGDGAAQLVLEGDRATDGSWTLSGRLTDEVDLIELVQKALGLTPSRSDFGSLVVSPVALTYNSGTGAVGASYTFDAAARWTPRLESVSFELDASVHLERSPAAKYSGAIMGSLGAHFGTHALELSVGYLFQQQNGSTSYVFGLRFDRLTLTGTYSKRANADEVVTVRLGGVTFGGIVTYLVNLADPDLHFALSPPWDVLNKIRFDDLSLVVNLTQRSVGITYKVGQDLGLIDIDTIGLTYVRSGGSPGVKLEITGSFLGQRYTPDQPLGWDLLKDSPPTPSGQGTQLFDLRLLGIGQHLVLVDPHADTMAKIIDELSAVVQKTKDRKQPWELLEFDAGAGWLLAADFTLMETLRLRLVFDDPVLYGVQITLAGEKAGIFAGLDFEILYRKLSDSLGVYHIALKLPDVMRHLEFGEVSITLPNVVVDIYTDGSFYLDLGFPYNNDWTVSFGLQVFPFVGAGGFYFGKLSTAAAAGTDLVPIITNGMFGPVIEFGVALQVGVGKTISEGPLRAGLSLTVQGIVTGVVSWFNPTDASLGSAQYYRIQGSVAVVGQLYGSVDFKIISIDISIVATASVTLTVESYQPILVGLSLDVQVHASIKIIFFTIHFSFGLHLDASFTIGSAQATPWTLAGPGAGGGPRASLVARRRAETSHHAHAAARALLVAAVPERAPLRWSPVGVLGAPVPIAVELMPFLTPAVVDGAPAAVQVVLAPFVQTSVPAGAGHDEWRTAVAGDPATTADDMAFNQIARALLKWGMQTLIGTHDGDVTAVDLHLIYDDLSATDVAERAVGFGYDNVAAFLGANLTLTLAGPPAKADAVARAVLPMPPPLRMAPPAPLPAVSFWEAPGVDARWREDLQAIFDELKVNAGYSRAPDPLGDDPDDPDDAVAAAADTASAGAEEPITEALFADWFLMVARSVFQSARNLLARHEHAPPAADSLLGLARSFAPEVRYTVQQDDTAASIADLFAITTAQLLARNPGVPIAPGQRLVVPAPVAEVEHVTTPGETLQTLATDWHVAAQAIEDANPDVDFAPLAGGTALRIPVPEAIVAIADANLDAPLADGPLTIGGLTHQVRTGETLGAIATAAHAADAGAVGAANAAAPGILLTGATLQIAAAGTTPATIPYLSQAGDTLTTLAAMLLVRDLGAVEHALGADASYAWLAGAIPALDANAGVVFSPLAAGVALEIPNVALGDKGLQPNGPPLAYTTKPGDTLALVAATFVLAELRAAEAGMVATEAAIRAANPSVDWSAPLPPATRLQLPARAHAIVVGDSLATLAARFWVTPRDLATLNATEPILAPTATLRLPAVSVPAAGLTLATLAAQLGVGAGALVGALGTHAGLFATGSKVKPLSIPEVRQLDVDVLCRLLVSSGEANSAAGQASSFLLQGLQVPVPKKAGQNAPLFALTGQQFPGPGAPQDTTITFTAPNGERWLSLAGGTVAVTLTQAQMQADWPSTTLDPQIAPGYPKAVPLGRSEAVRHRVAPPIPWAVPALPALSGPAPPAGGGPQLFALPASLRARVAADPGAHPYDLMTAAKGAQDAAVAVPTYAWATWVPFTVRRVPGPGGTTVANAYVALGADAAGADVLLALWTWLQRQDAGVTLHLGHADASGTGVVSEALDPARVALVKANLSTETHSPRAMADALTAGTPPPPAAATLADGWPFAQLLWEATITGSGGFYLNYETTAGGPLPDAVFAGGEDATLMLIAVLDEQATAGGPGYRTLHPFTTGALVEGNLDTGRYDVFAAAADGSDTTTVATAPPGNVAFALQRTNPSPAGGADPSAEDRTRALYSMLSLTLAGTGFGTPELVLPTAPKTDDDDPAAWRYDRTVPVYKQATTRPAPLPDALPDAARDDPYAGVAAGAAVTIDLRLRDRFGNDLGAGAGAGTAGPIAVGYYDPVIGVSGWPGATAAYVVDGPDGAAALRVVVDLGLDRYVPGPSNLFAAAVRGAAADRTTYGQAFFQLRQPDVTCAVTASLDPGGHACLDGAAVKAPLLAFVTGAYVYLGMAQALEPAELTVPAAGGATTLLDLATDLFVTPGQLAAANAAADASQLFAGPIVLPTLHVVRAGDTLTAIASAAALPVAALLMANMTVALNAGAVLQTAVRTYTPASGDTLTAIAALEDTTPADLAIANSATPGLLAPWSGTIGAYTLRIAATDTFATLVAQLAAQDATITTPADVGRALANLPSIFVAGTPIAIASAPVDPHDATGARTVTTVAGQTLAEVATAAGATAAGLALANGQTAGVLIPGTSVDVEGVTVAVPAAGSFVALVDALRAQGLVAGIAEVARALAGVTPLLAGRVVLAVADHVVAAGETLAASAVLTPVILALFDASATDVYAIGTPLVVATEHYGPQPGDTLAALAGENALTVDQLAGANALTALAPGAQLAHPGGVQVGATSQAPCQIAFDAARPPTVAAIATTFGTDAGALGTLNADMPGLFVPNVTIAYPGHPVTTSSASTPASLAAEAGAPDAGAFMANAAVADAAGLVAPGALFVAPLPPLAGALDRFATAVGVATLDLASANAALVGLVTPQHALTVTVGQATVTVTSGAHDTLATLLRRVQATAPGAQPADVVAACVADPAALVAGTPLIVPPAPVTLTGPLAEPVALSAPMTPLEVTITVARDPALRDPAFADAPDVAANATAVAPELGHPPALAGFATAFEAAFATRRLKLATGPQPAGAAPRLWVADFGPAGIARVTVDGGGARFHAVAPMRRTLAGGAVGIKSYNPSRGELGAPVRQTFASADLDGWMRAALTAIDLVLSPAVAAAAWRLDPAGVDALVAAKGTIARLLSERVHSILQSGDDPGADAAAQDALYQGMLVSLASAYATDAVITYPVTVTSPFSGPLAPRLSGKAVARQYQVAPGAGVAEAAAWYGVSLEAMASALADAQVLNAGAPGHPVTATFGGRSVEVGGADTLTTLAAALGAPTVLALLAGVTLAPAGAGLLRPGAQLGLGRATTTPSSTDSFTTVAAYFEQQPAALAIANQDRPGVLATQTLTYGGRTHPVVPTDTIAIVAQALALTPATLATAPGLGDAPGIFAATPLHALQVLPDLSLSTAKAPLADGVNHVAFLFGTGSDASFKSLFLDVDYDVSEIEFAIEDVPQAGDYRSSDWLRLVIPLGSSAFGGAVDLAPGQTQVPIPLRAFPLLPSVVDLTEQAAVARPATIAEAKEWELAATIQHQSAAQDTLQLEVAFGAVPAELDGDGPDPLLAPLAQFVAAWRDMQNDVAALAALPATATSPPAKLVALVGSLATLAGDLATGLAAAPRAFGRVAADGQLYYFALEPTIDHTGPMPVIDFFDLSVLPGSDAEDVPWPTVHLGDPSRPLQRVVLPDGRRRYTYNSPRPPAFASLTQTYIFPGDAPGRDAVVFETGQAAVAAQRNADLVTTAATAGAFLYQTPWVTFSSPAVPYLVAPDAIPAPTGADLQTAVAAALTELLSSDGLPIDGRHRIRLLCTYERLLAGDGADDGAVRMGQPVVYLPQRLVALADAATVASEIAARAATWAAAIQRHPLDAYVLDLSIFATADAAMTRPLVAIPRIVVPVTALRNDGRRG